MDYISSKEAAERWCVHIRVVQDYCKNGRINGAKKIGKMWMLPADAEKPDDPRRENKKESQPKSVYFFSPSMCIPKHSVKLVLAMQHKLTDPLAVAAVAYYSGNTEPMKKLWKSSTEEERRNLNYPYLAMVVAACTGDFALFDEVRDYLHTCAKNAENDMDKRLLALPEVFLSVSMSIPELAPDWLTQCDFSDYPLEMRHILLRHYIMHLRNIRAYPAMFAAAQATLNTYENPVTFSEEEIHTGILCAAAAYALEDKAQARRYLKNALKIAMPFDMLAPFADMLISFGGMLESLLEQDYPEKRKSVIALWNESFKNWMRFHNEFTKENITTVLNQQEYQAAYLISHGKTYSEVAERMNLSVSRIKNILAEVYGKLYIQKKQELNQFMP